MLRGARGLALVFCAFGHCLRFGAAHKNTQKGNQSPRFTCPTYNSSSRYIWYVRATYPLDRLNGVIMKLSLSLSLSLSFSLPLYLSLLLSLLIALQEESCENTNCTSRLYLRVAQRVVWPKPFGPSLAEPLPVLTTKPGCVFWRKKIIIKKMYILYHVVIMMLYMTCILAA